MPSSPERRIAFRRWIPEWGQVLCAFIIVAPVLMVSGGYSGNSVDVSGALGVLSEDISMALFASAAGMVVAYPLSVKLRPVIRAKTVLLGCLIIETILSWICATASHFTTILGCSFLIGFFKAFTLAEILMILVPILCADGKRGKFYAVYYAVSIGLSQTSYFVIGWFTYHYQWQLSYTFMMIWLLFAIIVVLICFRYGHIPLRFPLKEIDWNSVFYASVALFLLVYLFNYGRIENWFESPKIVAAAVLAPLFIALFLYRQKTSPDPYVSLSVLTRSSFVGYGFMLVTLVFGSSSALFSSYVISVLRLTTVESNELPLFMIPGIALGGVLTYQWYKRSLPMRGLVLIGFSCFAFSLALFYFRIEPGGLYSALYLPMIFRGAGYLILFAAFGTYVYEGIPPRSGFSSAFFIIMTRSVLGGVMGVSLFSNWLYRQNLQNFVKLAAGVDGLNPYAVARYNASVAGALAQKMPLADAQTIASQSLSGAIQVQSALLSLKMISGTLTLFALIVIAIVTVFPFYTKYHKREGERGWSGAV